VIGDRGAICGESPVLGMGDIEWSVPHFWSLDATRFHEQTAQCSFLLNRIRWHVAEKLHGLTDTWQFCVQSPRGNIRWNIHFEISWRFAWKLVRETSSMLNDGRVACNLLELHATPTFEIVVAPRSESTQLIFAFDWDYIMNDNKVDRLTCKLCFW